MIRRGLTLLELLITLALVLALAAVAMPMLLDGLEERAFESAAESICTQIMLARVEAQNSGRAVEIVYQSQPPRVLALTVAEPGEGLSAATASPDGAASLSASADSTSVNRRSGQASSPAREALLDDRSSSRLVPAAWAEQTLTRGIHLQTTQPPAAGDDVKAERFTFPPDEGEPPTGVMGPFEPGMSDDQNVRLAVLLPDGSALMQRPMWLTDAAGRSMKITTNRWTGSPETERQRTAPAPGDHVSPPPAAASTAEHPRTAGTP